MLGLFTMWALRLIMPDSSESLLQFDFLYWRIYKLHALHSFHNNSWFSGNQYLISWCIPIGWEMLIQNFWSESGPRLSLSTAASCEALALSNKRQSFEAMTKEIGLNFFIWTGQCPRRFVTSRFEGEFSACRSYIVALSIKTIETDAAEPDMSFFFPTSYSNSIPAVYRHISFASWGSTLAVSVFVAWSCRRDRIFLYQRERICNIQKDEIEKIK